MKKLLLLLTLCVLLMFSAARAEEAPRAERLPDEVLMTYYDRSLFVGDSLIVMFRIEWRLALIVALILPLGIALVMHRRRSMSRASIEVKAKQAGINAQIESSLSGMRTAKAFANEVDEIGKFNRSNESFKTSKSSFYKEMGRFTATLEFFTSILTVAVIGAGGYLIV